MSSVEADLARPAHLGRRRLLLALVTIGSAAVYVIVHRGATAPFATFGGACARLKASGLPITSQDWFCLPAPWTHEAARMGGGLLIWMMFVTPCAILAATGRRFTALLPMLVAPFADFTAAGVGLRWWGTAYWPTHQAAAVALNVVCLAAPVVAVSIVCRTRRPREGGDPSMASVFISGAVLLGSTYLILHFGQGGIDDTLGRVDLPWTVVLPMAMFGALLGPNRRWWPWSVAPVAVLMSFGPTLAVLSLQSRLHIWTLFRGAVPLAMVGLVWTAWWPLALVVTRRSRRARPIAEEGLALAVPIEPEPTATAPPSEPARRQRTVRPLVVLNALAVSMLAISIVIAHADPLPAEIGASLPTYLGVRANWQDVRARMDMREAMSSIDAYADDHGTYRGITAAIAAKIDPALSWTDRARMPASQEPPTLTMIVSTHGSSARIGAVSASGTAMCIERAGPGARLTYASDALARGSATGSATWRDRLATALATCDRAPWTQSLLQTVPVETLCNGMDGGESGYVICRMVQALGVQIFAHPKEL